VNIVFFSYFYEPDLSAGSFRSKSFIESLSKKLDSDDLIYVITTHPNRYASFIINSEDNSMVSNIVIKRIKVNQHASSIIGQFFSFYTYFINSYLIFRKLDVDFIVCTTSRHMTGLMTAFFSLIHNKKYYVDLRDIFSETISNLYSRKSKLIGAVLKYIFQFLEKNVLSNAQCVNVISESFKDYYEEIGLDTSLWTFYPNGIDKDFKLKSNVKSDKRDFKTILYAGNLGEGQAIEDIVPKLAVILGNRYQFKIIGDGGRRKALEKKIMKENIANILLLDPVSRSLLINEYEDSDILFLHLNDIPAFERVLPSKLFEYAVQYKPIIGGLAGYSRDFVSNEIPHMRVFDPLDFEECAALIRESDSINIDSDSIKKFYKKYNREVIMGEYTESILSHQRYSI